MDSERIHLQIFHIACFLACLIAPKEALKDGGISKGNGLSGKTYQWNGENGYVFFCLCMGKILVELIAILPYCSTQPYCSNHFFAYYNQVYSDSVVIFYYNKAMSHEKISGHAHHLLSILDNINEEMMTSAIVDVRIKVLTCKGL